MYCINMAISGKKLQHIHDYGTWHVKLMIGQQSFRNDVMKG